MIVNYLYYFVDRSKLLNIFSIIVFKSVEQTIKCLKKFIGDNQRLSLVCFNTKLIFNPLNP